MEISLLSNLLEAHWMSQFLWKFCTDKFNATEMRHRTFADSSLETKCWHTPQANIERQSDTCLRSRLRRRGKSITTFRFRHRLLTFPYISRQPRLPLSNRDRCFHGFGRSRAVRLMEIPIWAICSFTHAHVNEIWPRTWIARLAEDALS